MNTTQMALIMMAAFTLKHYLCDFPLQTAYQLGKGKSGTAWILPLLLHSSIHATFSAGIILAFGFTQYTWLALIELALHFVIDRIKATYKLPEGQWVGADKFKNLGLFYRAFGKDQTLHYLTYVLMLMILFK